jgi:subtilisin family serine protease
MVNSDSEERQPVRMSAGPGRTRDHERERVRGQVALVREQLGVDEVSIASEDESDDADFNYLFRTGTVLIRDQDLDRVSRVVQGQVRDSLVNGLTLYEVRGMSAPEALIAIDNALGVGVATPDHIVYVTPGKGGLCPAIEPEEPGSDPVYPPPVDADPGDGDGVLVSVVDTGWIPATAEHPETPWLQGVRGDEEQYEPESIRHYAGHGSFVAGVVRCLAPMAEVRVEGFLVNGGAIFESELVKQLNDALDDAPDIITMSAGTSSRLNRDLLGFQVFWETRLSRLKGTVLVAAAGNDGGRGPFSNFGSWVDVYARGVDLVNAYPSGTYITQEPPHAGERRRFNGLARWSGTSFSTPVVAGLIAARMSRTGENARQAADALMGIARANTVRGVGAVIDPACALTATP